MSDSIDAHYNHLTDTSFLGIILLGCFVIILLVVGYSFYIRNKCFKSGSQVIDIKYNEEIINEIGNKIELELFDTIDKSSTLDEV